MLSKKEKKALEAALAQSQARLKKPKTQPVPPKDRELMDAVANSLMAETVYIAMQQSCYSSTTSDPQNDL